MKGWAATIQRIAASDHRLMRKANRWNAPRWVRLWMICATRGGDGWLWYAMGLVILAFGGPQGRTATEAACAAGAAGLVLFLILKRLAHRRRPSAYEPHCWATLLPPDQFSFPSGHTITAFAVAVPLGLFYPALLVGLLFCALSVAVSRILLGLHFLSDVVAGASLGASLGYLAFTVFR
jgi:undecaprenyl-diphosphatase